MEVVSAILNVALKIAKAAETARENKASCLDLADRARTIGNILREDRHSGASMIAGGGDGEARRITGPPLERLKVALDDALELVESQRLSGGIEWGVAFFTGDKAAKRFQLLQTRISGCVEDLHFAKSVAAGNHAHDGNTRTAPLKQSPLRPSQLPKPSPIRPSQRVQPSPIRPSQLPKLSPIRPSQLPKPSPIRPSQRVQPSPIRPSQRVQLSVVAVQAATTGGAG